MSCCTMSIHSIGAMFKTKEIIIINVKLYLNLNLLSKLK